MSASFSSLVPLVDGVVSWAGNRVLISAATLEPIVAFLLIPAFLWVFGSIYFVRGGTPMRDNSYRTIPKSPIVRAIAATFLVFLIIALVSHAIGWATGSLRILSDGMHQVSTSALNHSTWTDVSAHQYQVWGARFVREDVMIGLLALAMVSLSLVFLGKHKAALADPG